MKQINETMQVRMTLDEANLVNELLKRNTAMPVKAEPYTNSDGEKKEYHYCTACGAFVGISSIHNFCPSCGQKQDASNIEL